jgi:hypothetical protein
MFIPPLPSSNFVAELPVLFVPTDSLVSVAGSNNYGDDLATRMTLSANQQKILKPAIPGGSFILNWSG